MTSLCSDASSSISSRRRQPHEENWDRMNDELQKRKEKGSVFSASPWEREEKEKLQREQLLDARRARDQEIAHLESIEDRTEKQEEWLRILRLEREFQRRAEQELHDDEEGSVCSENSDTDSEQVETLLSDKHPTIPIERHGLKLLEENSPKSSASSEIGRNERDPHVKSPSEKHFIPLELTIPDRDLHQPSSMALTHNILQVSEQSSDNNISRHSKPPIPAPRPSKAFSLVSQFISAKSDSVIYDHDRNLEITADSAYLIRPDPKIMTANTNSLTNLEISDASSYFCSTENGSDRSRDLPQDNWLIEVQSNTISDREVSKLKGDQKEESRIYENIKPMEYQNPKNLPNSSSKNGFGSHTLPRSTSCGSGLLMSRENGSSKNGSHFEKKFPSMGVTSTLSKKMNGFSAVENDILPALYASSKTRNGYTKDIPSDLVGKSPEFKKLWISRPEKLTFQDKIRKFSLQAGEDDVPRDRVKNSRAQREIENKFSDAQKKLASSSEV